MLREMMSADLFKWMLIFARLGAGAMMLPGLNSAMVAVRVRLLFALILSFVMLPVLGPLLPPVPVQPLTLFVLLLTEATVGIFFGVLTQAIVSALDMAGTSVGYAVGLTNMFTFDPVAEQQSQLMTSFLNLMAITLIFVSNSHHLMLRGLIESYDLIAPGQPLPTDDFASHLVTILGTSSMLGIRLAAPLLVFSITFHSGLALMNRLVPQIQVFFVGLPLQIMFGMTIFAICLPAIMLLFLRHLSEGIGAFLNFG